MGTKRDEYKFNMKLLIAFFTTDYDNCGEHYCAIDARIGGTAWNGESGCNCEVRLRSGDDLEYYATENLRVDGVSGNAIGMEFSSKFDFCYKQCKGKISEDSTFEPCDH